MDFELKDNSPTKEASISISLRDQGNSNTVTSTDEAAVDIIYLDVQNNDGSQVLDIASLLVPNDAQKGTSASTSKSLLQLSSENTSSTFIVDESGTMISLDHVSSSNLNDLDYTEVTAIAICQCWCGMEFMSQENLEQHKLTHNNQTFSREELHLQKSAHGSENVTSTKDLSLLYSQQQSEITLWKCNVCHRKFYKKIALKAHMRVHNIVNRYQCASCKKIFFYKTALNRHLKLHSCEKPFKCTICGDLYHTLWSLRKHRLNHQPDRLYRCEFCSKDFKQKQTLIVHSRLHSGQRPYSCDICSRSFSLKTTLVQHQRIHTGEKPNICPTCHRAFRQNSTLKAHIKTHTNTKPYICRYCKLRFTYCIELEEHEQSHARNKHWQCDQCGMWFKNQSLLLRHSRVHTNERPFHCSVCQKTFVQSGSLQAHIRSHTKEKPYQCRMCPKISVVDNNTNSTSSPSFADPLDEMTSYYTSGTLLIHIRKAHNMDAKSVKDVFPVVKFVEDQKVFTVRNKHIVSNQVINTKPDKNNGPPQSIEEMLTKNSISENVFSKYQHDVENLPIEVEQVEVGSCEESAGGLVLGSHESVSDQAQDASNKLTVDIDTDGEMPAHTALDRQEAALSLAELSLGVEASLTSEKPPKTKTFYKDEEIDENDPNVMKIILSKEGGIMNSQDPHQCPVCGRIFGRKSIMVEHLRIHTDEKPYQCDFCHVGFRQNAQLRSHIRNKHTKVEKYECFFCHKRFLSHNITIRHINFHHKLKVKYCESVDSSWNINSAVLSDADDMSVNGLKKEDKLLKANVHDSSSSVGSRNNKDYFVSSSHDIDAATESLQAVMKDSALEMPPLQKDIEIIYVHNEHQELGMADASQEINSKMSTAEDQLESGASTLICGTCSVQFHNISSLQLHLLHVHKTVMHKSELSLMFEDSALTSHQKDLDGSDNGVYERTTPKVTLDDDTKLDVVSKVMPYVCNMCPTGFISKSDLQGHMQNHSDEDVERVGMHRCDVCLFVMKNTQQVAKHIVKCHGVQQIYMCSICSREFYQESSVYRHMRFFHKWEIKIRGEGNIPVLMKPASPSLKINKDLLSTKVKQFKNVAAGLDLKVKLEDLKDVNIQMSDEVITIVELDHQKVKKEVIEDKNTFKDSHLQSETIKIELASADSSKATSASVSLNTTQHEMGCDLNSGLHATSSASLHSNQSKLTVQESEHLLRPKMDQVKNQLTAKKTENISNNTPAVYQKTDHSVVFISSSNKSCDTTVNSFSSEALNNHKQSAINKVSPQVLTCSQQKQQVNKTPQLPQQKQKVNKTPLLPEQKQKVNKTHQLPQQKQIVNKSPLLQEQKQKVNKISTNSTHLSAKKPKLIKNVGDPSNTKIQAEQNNVSRSSSGRIIKRKLFDDEIVDIGRAKKKKASQ